ncbi:hypothetical protein CYME_CMR296C [Cyanidioschyzon merolae strain 10D]|jgi:gas vesicle protein|uniref:BAR domain-containing protein n=1 Tax=Cyanidioschyzon merolae (strain NIES-3377 / 10D) TaxID=280699 RepID=M1UWD6_CYAM1|nr:hypothetical protein CYME_CMR296C [Cyanidioschyzon merolae strain 10D]BAM82511.1 hypothetical protein CYME_CMR296C [Cyanidioschyzon merolae strain 10D]|eukprot:XP_005538547.1 hypothetical protein CYME_CMR296C [Cyanidioschyzon merolae strain 10D]
MALSCFCAKRTFQSFDRTPLPEYEENKRKVNAIESSLGRLIRDLEAVQSNWVRLGDVLKAFASDLSGALPESSSENVKDTSEKLAKSSEEVGNELRQTLTAEKASPSSKILSYLKEFRKRLAECKQKSSKMENLAKDYDARRAVVDDKEKANTPEPKLQRVRDLMYEAEMKFREAEKNVLQLQKSIIDDAPFAFEAAMVGLATILADRSRLLQEKGTTFRTIRDAQLDAVLKRIDST